LASEYDNHVCKIDLQFFADPSKTEEPTQRKLEKAREEGNVPVSREFTTGITFLALAGILSFLGGPIAKELEKLFYDYFDMNTDLLNPSFFMYSLGTHSKLYVFIALFFGMGMAVTLGLGFIQTRFMIAPKALKFDLSKINPIKGFKRIFSMRSLFELFKAILKIIIIGWVAYSIISGKMNDITNLAGSEIAGSVKFIVNMILELMYKLGLSLLILSLADYWFQKFQYRQDLKMTKQEVKEEMKDIEGNPEIKRKQREFMTKIVFSRMMQQVPTADVVVTNPTHYAVAIKYESKGMNAPKVVAKGVDEMAMRIRKVASENGVPIVQKPSLARELYAKVELDEEVPQDLYKAVAEVLAYIYKLSNKNV